MSSRALTDYGTSRYSSIKQEYAAFSSNQILKSDKHHQILFVGGPNMSITNPRWRTAAIFEKSKYRHIVICMLFYLHNRYDFWATVFALCYRSVVLSCLSVTFVHCGQTVGRIKMKLGMHVGLGPGHIVLGGDSAPAPPKGHSPQFSTHIGCGQMAAWIKMSLGMELGLGKATLY